MKKLFAILMGIMGVGTLALTATKKGFAAPVAVPVAAPNKCNQAPDELRLASQGGLYSCKKLGCDGETIQEPPFASSNPVPINAQILCDAANRFIVRVQNQALPREEFGTKDRCLRASEQFKTYRGCYCTPEFTPVCLMHKLSVHKFEELSQPYSRQDACIQALEQLSQSVELKQR